MEDNIDIINLVLAKLDSEDIWFTSKLDPTIEEASSYYQLDEYGEPTEKTVKKIFSTEKPSIYGIMKTAA